MRSNWIRNAAICVNLAAVLSIAQAFAQTPTTTYLSEIAAARREVVETETLRIEDLDLGAARIGENKLTAMVVNKSDSVVKIALDVRADPGLWLKKSQRQFLFEFKPREEKKIEAHYTFTRMSAEAWLRIRFGHPTLADDRMTGLAGFFDRKYQLGRGNEAVNSDLSAFKVYQTERMAIYYFEHSFAARNIDAIAALRASAFQGIMDLLGVDYSGKIRIFLFPDAESKKRETGHTGDGWAFANNIVEVYNEKIQLDPYHELAHIITGQLGDPPAFLDEGFAVYVSEKMGSDALKYLQHGGESVDGVVRAYRRQGALIPIEKLFGFADIGSPETKAVISYPQSASIVKYLVDRHGMARFKQAFATLRRSSDAAVILQNKRSFAEIYGQTLPQLEQEWLSTLAGER